MAEERAQRRLAAIVVADVVGYSRLMQADEEGTLAALRLRRTEVLQPLVLSHGGRIVKFMGDGVLIEFASAVNAVTAALELQREMARANSSRPEGPQIVLRVGINLGDVIGQGPDIYGDGVNIAARIEPLAEPGGVCVSAKVRAEVDGKVQARFEGLGDQNFKNIATPVGVFHARPPTTAIAPDAELAEPDRPSIAVLAFQNMSGDPEQEYFSDGIAEDIITALSKLRWFFVIARNSSFSYKGKSPDVRQVARELGVRYVLEGSVRRLGNRLRVTSQLIDAQTGGHVWAERYDRDVSDLFAVQDEITENVVASIESQVFALENLRTRNRPTESLDAWGCVVQAMPHLFAWASQDSDTGIMLLQRAVALDPGYARASSLLSMAHSGRAHRGNGDIHAELAIADALARRAAELDAEDPWSHVATGYSHMIARRFNPAVAALAQAVSRNPSFAFAQMVLGSANGYGHRTEDGMRHLAIAARLSPRDHVEGATLSTAGLCHFMDGRYGEAVDFLRRAVQLRPNFGTAWRTLSASAGLAGDSETGRTALAEALRLQPNLSAEWIRQFHPIVESVDRERYIDGLRKAGMTE